MSTWPIDAISKKPSVSLDYGIIGACQLLNPSGYHRAEKVENNEWTFARYDSYTGVELVDLDKRWDILSLNPNYKLPKLTELPAEATNSTRKATSSSFGLSVCRYVPRNLFSSLAKESQLASSAESIYNPHILNTFCLGKTAPSDKNRYTTTECLACSKISNETAENLLFLCLSSPWIFRASPTLQNTATFEEFPFYLNVSAFEFAEDPIWKFSQPVRQLVFSNGEPSLLFALSSCELVIFQVTYDLMFLDEPNTPGCLSAIPLRFLYADDVYNSDSFANVSVHPTDNSFFLTTSSSGRWTIWQFLDDGYRECFGSSFKESLQQALCSAPTSSIAYHKEEINPDNTIYRAKWEEYFGGVILHNAFFILHVSLGEVPDFHLLFHCSSDVRILQVVNDSMPIKSEFFILTTESVLWMDIQHPQKPLLEWKHNRKLDPTLKITVTATFSQNIYVSVYSQMNGVVQQIHFSKDRALPVSGSHPFLLLNEVQVPIRSLIIQPCYFFESSEFDRQGPFDSPFWSAIIDKADGSLSLHILCEKSSLKIYNLEELTGSSQVAMKFKTITPSVNTSEDDSANDQEIISTPNSDFQQLSLSRLYHVLCSNRNKKNTITLDEFASKVPDFVEAFDSINHDVIITLSELYDGFPLKGTFTNVAEIISHLEGTELSFYFPYMFGINYNNASFFYTSVDSIASLIHRRWESNTDKSVEIPCFQPSQRRSIKNVIHYLFLSSIGVSREKIFDPSLSRKEIDSTDLLTFIKPFYDTEGLELNEDVRNILENWEIGKISSTYVIGDSAVETEDPSSSQFSDFYISQQQSSVLPSSQIATVFSQEDVPNFSSLYSESSSQTIPIMSQVVSGKYGSRPSKKKKKRSGF
ncbi:RNA polymerase I transcription factor subunit Rrn6 [Schizosaccharomyces pombe]